MPTVLLTLCTFSASSQYCARTDEVAASRPGVFPGVFARGSVSLCHASVVWPPIPPGEDASAIRIATGTSASAASRPRPASRRVRASGGYVLV
jgi:hypothetical protein